MSTRIVADACSNHMGDRRVMEEMIKQAAGAGVDYIKWQSFHADKLNPNWPDYENAKTYYKSVELSEDDHAFIIAKCKQCGIKPLFTAFDADAAMLLFGLGLDIVKIASPSADNHSLTALCAVNFDKVIVSCGMTTTETIREFRALNNVDLLYCISRYPCPKEMIDFDKMALFDGFSDHTPDIECAKKAIDMDMDWIERHYTLGKYLPGKDHLFSSTPDEFKELVDYRNYIAKIPLYKERFNG